MAAGRTRIDMSANRSSTIPQDIIDARSPANQYLVQLLEDKGTVSFRPLTVERIQLVFQILHNVTPQLGTFSRLMELISNELYDAVYSRPGHLQGASQVPYFTLVQRRQNLRNEEAERTAAELQRVTSLLSQEEGKVVSLKSSIASMWEERQTLQSTVAALTTEATESCSRMEMLEAELRALERKLEEEKRAHAHSLSDLQDRLQVSFTQVRELEERMASHRALQRAFQPRLTQRKQNRLAVLGREPAHRTSISPAFVSSYLQAALHTHQQLLHVRNIVMDDFDAYLERQTDSAGMRGAPSPPGDEMTIFLTRLFDLSLELSLLSQQIEGLEEKETTNGQVSRRMDPTNLPLADSGFAEESAGGLLAVALYPDEALLNRYAAMIYTSTDGGKIFQELPGAAMCHSCAEKTLLCPHKVGVSRLIQLPRNCTHLRICRPLTQQAAVQSKAAVSTSASPETSCPENPAAKYTQNSQDIIVVQSRATSWAVKERVCQLEEESEKNMKRESRRMLSQGLCVSLTQQLAAIILLQLKGQAPSCCLQDAVHSFFRKRYVSEEVSARGMEDYLFALRRHALDSKVLSLLASVLQLHMNPAILGYVCLQVQILQATPLFDMNQLQLFMQQLFPFLEEAEQDVLLLECTAYTEKHLSPSSIMEFMLHLNLQHRDPLILECEEELSTHTRNCTGHLTAEQLALALDTISPLTDKMEVRSLIQRTVTLTSSSLIPLRSAAQITAYLLQHTKQQQEKSPAPKAPPPDTAGTGNKVSNDLQLLQEILRLSRNR